MHAFNANEVPGVVAAQPMTFAQDPYSTMRNDYAKMLIIFGSLQIAFGAITIIFEAVSVGITDPIFIGPYVPWAVYTFLSGIIFVSTGPLGIVGGKRRSRTGVIAFNMLSIVSACFTVPLLASGILNARRFIQILAYLDVLKPELKVLVAMDFLLVIIAVAELIVAISSSVICFKIGGCGSDYQVLPSANAPPVQVATTGQQPYSQQHMPHPMAYGQQQYSYNQ